MAQQSHDTMRRRARTIGQLLALFVAFTAVSSAVAAAEKARQKTRTLDAIIIEGEIAVPQVLFITSRDYPRYRDGLGLQFRMTAIHVARSLDLPKRLRIVAQSQLVKEEGP